MTYEPRSSGPPPPPPLPVWPVRTEPEGSAPAERARFVMLAAVAGALLAVPVAAAWVRLSDPPAARMTADGLLFGESELDQAVGVTLWFLVLGVAAGLLGGLVVGWLGRRHGVATVGATVCLCVVGCAVTYLLGVHVLGPDEQEQRASARTGDRVTSAVSVTSKVAYLGWPVGGLLGAMGGILQWPESRQSGSGMHSS